MKNSPNPYHRARWEVQELRAFAALRNRREQQWRRLLPDRARTSEVRMIYHWRGCPVSGFKRRRIIRRQRQDGVRR